MSAARPVPARLVPTLTVVVEVAADSAQDDMSTMPMHGPGRLEESPSVQPQAAEEPVQPPAADEPQALPAPAVALQGELTERVLAQVQQRVQESLDDRLLEALTPALLKLGEAWAAQARAELASTLRSLVEEAVAQELARHREPG